MSCIVTKQLINEMAEKLKVALDGDVEKCVAFYINLDENNDYTDKSQLKIFINAVDQNVKVTED